MDLEKEDRIISEFLKSLGPWKNHIVIGGGYAPIIYKLYLANHLEGNPPVGTRDVDSLIPRTIPEVSSKNISKHLEESGFKLFFKDYDNPATEAYIKKIDGVDVEIEFLTDAASRSDKSKNILIAGVAAQPLSYLKLSLQKTVKFETFSGEMGRVVSPAAWMFHKGLTFPKRTNESKVYKDLYGIWYVSTQLGTFSEQAIIELNSLAQDHPKWFESFQVNLRQWIEDVAPIDWAKLETQDPFGKLKKLTFERLIKTLI